MGLLEIIDETLATVQQAHSLAKRYSIRATQDLITGTVVADRTIEETEMSNSL